MRKAISIILTVLMILGSCPAAFAADEAPACTVTGLEDGDKYFLNVGDAPTVVVTGDSITQVEFKVDGVSQGDPDTEAPFEWTLPTDASHKGAHKLGVYVNGSEEASKEINYTAVWGMTVTDYSEDFETSSPEYVYGTSYNTYNANNSGFVEESEVIKPVVKAVEDLNGMNGNVLYIENSTKGAGKGRTLLTTDAKISNDYDLAVIEFDYAQYLTYMHVYSYVFGTSGWYSGSGHMSSGNYKGYGTINKTRMKFVIDGATKISKFYDGDELLFTSSALSALPQTIMLQNDYTVSGYSMIDNISIKTYEPAPDFTADFSCEEGTTDYKITFSNEIFGEDDAVNAEIANKVVFLNGEGTPVEDRVDRTYGTDSDGDYVILTINQEGIDNIADYKIKVDALSDIYGQELTKEFLFSDFTVTGVELDKETITLVRGGITETLSATVTPDSAINKNVTWESSDEDVATVDENGVVTSNKPGTATITATTEDGGYTASCEVTVVDATATSAGLKDGDKYFLNVGDAPTVVVSGDSLTQVEFKVDGESQSIDTEAPFEWTLPTEVSHKGDHTLGIYLNGSEEASEEINYTAVWGMTVVDYSDDFETSSPEYVYGTNYKSYGTTNNYFLEESEVKKPVVKTVEDSYGMNGNVLYVENNKTVAGAARVLLTPEAEIGTDYDLAVIEFDFAMSPYVYMIMYPNQTSNVSWYQGNNSNKALNGGLMDPTYKNSINKTRVKVVIDGVTKTSYFYLDGVLKNTVTGYTNLPDNIMFRYDYTSDGYFMIDNISIKSYAEAPDFTADISCEEGTTDYKIIFSNKIFGEDDAANAEIANKVVWLNGEGTPVEDRVSRTYGTDSEGNDWVMLSINEEGVENIASYKIKIDAVSDIYTQELTKEFPFSAFKVTGITLDKETITLVRGGITETLSATVTPDSAINKNIVWTSSDEDVATVDEDGVVTSNKPGTATITATTADGGFTASCEVKVINPSTSTTTEGVRSIVEFKPGAPVTGATGATNAKDEWVTDYVRVGKYALHSTGTGRVSFKINTPVSVNNSAPVPEVLKMWVYNNSEDEIRLGTRLQLSTSSYSAYSTQATGGFTLAPQSWTLIEFPICQPADGSGQVEYLNFNLGGSYVEPGVENVNSGKKVDLYFNEAQLIQGKPNAFDIAETSYADGATGVNPNLRSYRVTFTNNLSNPAAAADEVVLLDSTGAVVEGVTRTYGSNYVELKVYDDAALEPVSLNPGEEYTVLVKKRVLYDEVGQTLSSDKSYTFTTASEGVKFAPSVVITSPVDFERYAVGDTNTLKAMAFDDDGEIASVKFYNKGTLIGEAISEGDGLYSYEWSNIPASESFTDYLEITAVAIDNDGKSTTSAAVKILVFDYIAPEIDAVVPTTYYNSIGGGKVDNLIISGTFDDQDGSVKSIVIEIDDEEVYRVTDPIDNFSFTSSTQFAVKDGYKVDIIATDDDGMTTMVTEYFDSVAGSRESEPFYNKDVTDPANSGLWMKSSATMVTEIVADKGFVVTAKDSGNSILSTTISDNIFKTANTQVDLTLNFGSNTNRRLVSIGGINIAEFRANGTVVDSAGAAIGGGMKYSANTNYTLSLISNPATGKGVCLINGHVIKDLVTISPSGEMDIEITQTLSEDGSAEFTIVDYAAYLIGAAVTDASITLNKEVGTIADGETNVAVDAPQSISVAMADLSEDVDLTKAVTLVDNLTGKACALKMVDGKLTIASKLAHGTSYTIKLNGGLFNNNGETYAGNASFTFTTKATSAEKLVVVDREGTGKGFNVNEISYTALGEDGATVGFTSSIKNDSGETKTVYVAIIVYKGNKIVSKTIEQKSILNGGDDVSVSAVVPEIAEDVSVQAFILDSLTSPKSIAEDIFVIK